MRNTAATVRMAYNSGKAARISVLPITSWPLPIAAIPLAQTFDWKYDEARQTRPVSRPAPKMAAPCSSVIESVRKPLMMK